MSKGPITGICEDDDVKNPVPFRVDRKGRVVGIIQQEKTCIDSIDQSDLVNNVYTVQGDPATGLDGLINDGPNNLVVVVADKSKTITKTLKPFEVWDMDFEGFTTLTFSAGAEFRADIMR